MNHPSINSTPRGGRPARRPRRPPSSHSLARTVVCALTLLLVAPVGTLRGQTRPAPADSLRDAQVGQPYTFTFNADGGTPPLTWGIVSGGLPDGLTLDSDSGVLSGTPTASRATPYAFTVEVTDSTSPRRERFRRQFTLLVSEQRARPLSIATLGGAGAAASGPAQGGGVVAEPEEESAPPDCDVLDVESNSDTISIAVRNEFVYDPEAATQSVINLKNRQTPIVDPGGLIRGTLGQCNKAWEKDDYVIVHLVKWPLQNPPGGAQKFEPESERWFLYKWNGVNTWERQAAQGGTRIYGHKRVGVLLVHLTARQTWDIKYNVDVKKKTPAPIQNILDLAAIIRGGAGVAKTAAPPSFWGGRMLLLQDIPADIIVQSNIAFVANVASAGGSNDKETQQPKSYSKTYDNEGRYHWDVSVGLPVKSFKEVQYDAEGGQVRAREITRQNAYGFLNLFFNPRGVDTKGEEFYKTPHLVLGVPISGKPLDRPMVGLGMGFYETGFKFNVFGGIVFNRVREPQTLAAGQTATDAQLQGDLRTRRVREFIFGFNIPVKQFKDALTPKK